MLWRIAEHYVGVKLESEHKYKLLAEAQRRGYCVKFDNISCAHSVRKADIEEELGRSRRKITGISLIIIAQQLK